MSEDRNIVPCLVPTSTMMVVSGNKDKHRVAVARTIRLPRINQEDLRPLPPGLLFGRNVVIMSNNELDWDRHYLHKIQSYRLLVVPVFLRSFY